MNEAGRSVGPARGALRVELDHVLVVHDEIDLPFGEVRTRLGGGLAGHNGLKSVKAALGSADFMRVRAGVGRPDSTDPEIVSSYVLGRFRESPAEVGALVERAAEHVERVLLGEEPPAGAGETRTGAGDGRPAGEEPPAGAGETRTGAGDGRPAGEEPPAGAGETRTGAGDGMPAGEEPPAGGGAGELT